MDANSKFLRVHSITVDSLGIDPLLDKFIPSLVNIAEYKVHVVQQDERGAPDLISYREYGTEELWWIILAYNGVGSYRNVLEGTTLRIPDSRSVIALLNNNTIRENVVQRVVTI